MTRPVAITVVAWVIIASSLEGLLGMLGGLTTPLVASGTLHTTLSLSATLWAGGITVIANLILATLILAGLGWARIVYIIILALGFVEILIQGQPISIEVHTGIELVIYSYFF